MDIELTNLVEIVKMKLGIDFLEPSSQRQHTESWQLSESVDALSDWHPVLWHATKKCLLRQQFVHPLLGYLTQSADKCLSPKGCTLNLKKYRTLLCDYISIRMSSPPRNREALCASLLTWPSNKQPLTHQFPIKQKMQKKSIKWEAGVLKACGVFHSFLFCHNMGVSQYSLAQLEDSLFLSHLMTYYTQLELFDMQCSDNVINTVKHLKCIYSNMWAQIIHKVEVQE